MGLLPHVCRVYLFEATYDDIVEVALQLVVPNF